MNEEDFVQKPGIVPVSHVIKSEFSVGLSHEYLKPFGKIEN